ncbi:MAG: AbrB/MazE/SpoVT family DNA-binding domain-containing protein [Pararhizobium sp.]
MGLLSRLTAKGQTTIPLEVRRYLDLHPGDRLTYTMRDGKVEIGTRKLRATDLAGILGPPPSGRCLSVKEMNDAVMDAVAEDDERIKREWHEGLD